jgi:hypothetical protein
VKTVKQLMDERGNRAIAFLASVRKANTMAADPMVSMATAAMAAQPVEKAATKPAKKKTFNGLSPALQKFADGIKIPKAVKLPGSEIGIGALTPAQKRVADVITSKGSK